MSQVKMVLYQMIILNYFVLPYRIKWITIRMWMHCRWRNLHYTHFLFRFRFIHFLVWIILWVNLWFSFMALLIRIRRKLRITVWNRRQLNDFTSQYLAFDCNIILNYIKGIFEINDDIYNHSKYTSILLIVLHIILIR